MEIPPSVIIEVFQHKVFQMLLKGDLRDTFRIFPSLILWKI